MLATSDLWAGEPEASENPGKSSSLFCAPPKGLGSAQAKASWLGLSLGFPSCLMPDPHPSKKEHQ